MRRARLLSVALLAACGGGGSGDADFEIVPVPGGISQIRIGEKNLTEATGGYYLIGSCSDRDSAESNVTSIGASGGAMLGQDPNCPGAPFEIRVELLPDRRGLRTDVTVGPLPVAYASLSVPLDVRSEHVDVFRTDVAPIFVGGCGDVDRRETSEGTFDSIHTPCPAGVGGTGVAETRRPATVAVIEGGARIERRILAGDAASVRFFRNLPIDVENSEIEFGPRPAGSVVTLSEEIRIHD